MAIHDQPDYELSDISEDQCIAFDELIDEFIDFSAGSNSELTPEQPRQQITSNHPDASGMNTRELPSEATPATSIESLLSSVVGNDANGFMPTLSGSTQHTLKDVVADCGSVAPTFPHPIVGSSSSYAPYTYEESRCKDYNYGIHGGVTDDAHYLPSMIPTVGEPERGGPVTPPRENGYNLQPVEIPPSINGSPMKSPEDRTRDLPKNSHPTIANRDTTHSSPSVYLWAPINDHLETKGDGRKNNALHKLKQAQKEAGLSVGTKNRASKSKQASRPSHHPYQSE